MPKSAAIHYNHDGYACEGFAIWDEAGAERPGILVFPEWVGVGEYTEKRAKMLAEIGFNAFVVDVYGKGIRPNTPETCQAEMMKYATNRPLLRQRARCGLEELRKLPNTDLSRLGAIGYCFGGMAVLEMARDGQNDLAGIVSFHGVLATPTPLKPNTYKGKILALHGVLHLAGYDHESDNGTMARREELLRKQLGLPVGLIERNSTSKTLNRGVRRERPRSSRRDVSFSSPSRRRGQ